MAEHWVRLRKQLGKNGKMKNKPRAVG